MTQEAENLTHLSRTRKGAERETDGTASAAPVGVSGGLVELLLLEDAARELAVQIAEIESLDQWRRWRHSNGGTLAAVHRLVSDSPAKRTLTKACRAATTAFGPSLTPEKAQTRGKSRRSP